MELCTCDDCINPHADAAAPGGEGGPWCLTAAAGEEAAIDPRNCPGSNGGWWTPSVPVLRRLYIALGLRDQVPVPRSLRSREPAQLVTARRSTPESDAPSDGVASLLASSSESRLRRHRRGRDPALHIVANCRTCASPLGAPRRRPARDSRWTDFTSCSPQGREPGPVVRPVPTHSTHPHQGDSAMQRTDRTNDQAEPAPFEHPQRFTPGYCAWPTQVALATLFALTPGVVP